MKRLFYGLIAACSCIGCISSPENGQWVHFKRETSSRALADIVEQVEWIPLQTEGVPLMTPSSEMFVPGDSSFVIWDKKQSEVFRFSSSGTFLNRIGRRGNGPGEYVSIANVQVDKDKIIVFSMPNKVLFYNLEGELDYEDYLKDMGHQSHGLGKGSYLTYYGFGTGRGYRLNLYQSGKESHFLDDEAHVINMTPDAPVFWRGGDRVYFTDTYRPEIRVYENKEVKTCFTVDFDKYSIPDKFYSFDQAFAAMEYLLSREFALIQRYMQTDSLALLEAFIQSGNKVEAYYGLRKDQVWRWFSLGKKGESPFFGTCRYMDKSQIYFLVDPYLLQNEKESSPFIYNGCINPNGNPIVVKLTIK